ncbi:hypothetical protein GQX73_g6237 [Xylaria multiplex]|uniref:VIT domain-containing protein n=1 Tax=Xylaria multiplex TaxID=323545 RepID=A0A7C8N5V2_9PEZI|nr:hypothetical protein GQX73_g6237 [Xylaria multiplex]
MAYINSTSRRQGIYSHKKWTRAGYPLLSSSYKYMVRDVFVEATLTETYQAQTRAKSEVSYVFEVPPEAAVIRFSAEVGGNQIEAIVEEKAEASRKYRQAKNEGIQAWKLDKVNDEVFQISLGNIAPKSSIVVHVTYAYVISSDTIEDTVRLTIPTGWAARSGTAPISEVAVPTAPSGENAVTISVGIEVTKKQMILDLNSLSHHATITNGFCDDSFKTLTPVEKGKAYEQCKSYVYYTSKHFMDKHFVLTWAVPKIDTLRCVIEQFDGEPWSLAVALTLVSNIELDPEEHEYIFLVDQSESMSGVRTSTANDIVKTMLGQLPTEKRSSFNIYKFNTKAWSILLKGQSLEYDKRNVSKAIRRLKMDASGSTDINAALATVFDQRNTSKPRCSVIIITDGLDWGITAAMKTIQKHVQKAAAESQLLRVFVLGLGDDVSRSMCEALARTGCGSTAYISESQLQDQDHQLSKAETMINSINRAPIRVRSIDWGVTTSTTIATQPDIGKNMETRPRPNRKQLGAVAKGDNLPPPAPIQQAPLPGSMFWAVRSYWYAIIDRDSDMNDLEAKITYEVLGRPNSVNTIEFIAEYAKEGRFIHSLAAQALIQRLEDKAISITDPAEKYRNECEIIRLGKTYSLASSQTSFVATANGVGTCTRISDNKPPNSRSLLSGIPLDSEHVPFANTQGFAAEIIQADLPVLEFITKRSAQAQPETIRMPQTRELHDDQWSGLSMARGVGPHRAGLDISEPLRMLNIQDDDSDASSVTVFSATASFEPPMAEVGTFEALGVTRGVSGNDWDASSSITAITSGAGGDGLSELIAAQDGDGSFDPNAIRQLLFPSTSTPAVPAFISILNGQDDLKNRIWLAICVVAWFQKKHEERSGEWSNAQTKAEEFVKTTLRCVFRVTSRKCANIYANSLDDAVGYF